MAFTETMVGKTITFSTDYSLSYSTVRINIIYLNNSNVEISRIHITGYPSESDNIMLSGEIVENCTQIIIRIACNGDVGNILFLDNLHLTIV